LALNGYKLKYVLNKNKLSILLSINI